MVARFGMAAARRKSNKFLRTVARAVTLAPNKARELVLHGDALA